MELTDSNEFISTPEAESKYNVSRETLRQLVRSGKLPVYRAKGNKNYYKIDELESVISELFKFRRIDPNNRAA